MSGIIIVLCRIIIVDFLLWCVLVPIYGYVLFRV